MIEGNVGDCHRCSSSEKQLFYIYLYRISFYPPGVRGILTTHYHFSLIQAYHYSQVQPSPQLTHSHPSTESVPLNIRPTFHPRLPTPLKSLPPRENSRNTRHARKRRRRRKRQFDPVIIHFARSHLRFWRKVVDREDRVADFVDDLVCLSIYQRVVQRTLFGKYLLVHLWEEKWRDVFREREGGRGGARVRKRFYFPFVWYSTQSRGQLGFERVLGDSRGDCDAVDCAEGAD